MKNQNRHSSANLFIDSDSIPISQSSFDSQQSFFRERLGRLNTFNAELSGDGARHFEQLLQQMSAYSEAVPDVIKAIYQESSDLNVVIEGEIVDAVDSNCCQFNEEE